MGKLLFNQWRIYWGQRGHGPRWSGGAPTDRALWIYPFLAPFCDARVARKGAGGLFGTPFPMQIFWVRLCCLLCLFKLIPNVFLQLVEFETQATAGVITWDVSSVLGYPGESWMVLSDAWSFMWPGFFQEADTQLVMETAQAYWQSYDGGG